MIETVSISIWGRAFSLPIVYDCFEGESITEKQIESLNQFIAHKEWIATAKNQVEEYCEKRVMEDEENIKKDNVFSYVMPEAVYVKRDPNKPRVALMCRYRYDLEHGLAIVFFPNDGAVSVGSQDIVL